MDDVYLDVLRPPKLFVVVVSSKVSNQKPTNPVEAKSLAYFGWLSFSFRCGERLIPALT
jgi:hypothetical protein